MGIYKKHYDNLKPLSQSKLEKLNAPQEKIESEIQAQIALGTFDPSLLTSEIINNITDETTFKKVFQKYYKWIKENNNGTESKTQRISCLMTLVQHPLFKEKINKTAPNYLHNILKVFGIK